MVFALLIFKRIVGLCRLIFGFLCTVHRVNMVSCHECTAVTLPYASFHQLQHTRLHIMIICMELLHLRLAFFLVSTFCFLLLLATQGCKLSFYWLLRTVKVSFYLANLELKWAALFLLATLNNHPSLYCLHIYRMHGRQFVLGGHTWAGTLL